MEPIWDQRPEDYLNLESESRLVVLHPWLRERVSQLHPGRVLDFGSGDGSLFNGSSSGFEELWLYDPSAPMMSLARARYAGRPNVTFASAPHELPDSSFDAVVCSLVLMTIDNQGAFRAAVDLMYATAVEGATVLVAVTHPCFRQHPFSTFETDWSEHTSSYLAEGTPFRVRLFDADRKTSVEFTDFHWPLAFTVNAFVGAGFDLAAMAELRDAGKMKEFQNNHVPPYLVLEFERSA